MQRDQTPADVTNAFSRHLVYDKIFCHLSPASLIRVGRTSKSTFAAIEDFSYRAFDINRSLSRFVSDPIAFRNLQARTSALISGSFALQFFDRTFYPEADLDIYTPESSVRELGDFLMNDGYVFRPNSQQQSSFEQASERKFSMMELSDQLDNFPVVGDQLDTIDAEHLQKYKLNSILEVYTFVQPNNSPSLLKVQIIVPKATPFQCILEYHSTCVLNLIAYNAAYSLYPYATFERRESLTIDANDYQGVALSKYSRRGWRVIASGSPLLLQTDEGQASLENHFYLGQTRWTIDSKSWVIRLNTAGIRDPPPPSPSSVPITWHPAAECSWKLIIAHGGNMTTFRMSYNNTRTGVLQHGYTIADYDYLEMLIDFFVSQGKLEHSKVSRDKSSLNDVWTWWDSVLPAFRQAYWNKLKANDKVS